MFKQQYKKSSYTAQYETDNNKSLANEIGQFITWNHSQKIKSGIELEHLILVDFYNRGMEVYKNIKIICPPKNDDGEYEVLHDPVPVTKGKTKMTLPQLQTSLTLPCVINKFSIDKKLYSKNNEVCYNKKEKEIDFVYIKLNENRINITLFEVKNGCDFDTKKSNGEVQSLISTKSVFNKEGFTCLSVNIVCYDAHRTDDISIKTDLDCVELQLYEKMVSTIGLDGVKSREYINNTKKEKAKRRLVTFFEKINSILMNGWDHLTNEHKRNIFSKLMKDSEFVDKMGDYGWVPK